MIRHVSVPRMPIAVHPLLAAVFPVLALGARNVQQLAGPGELVVPLLISAAAALAGWIVSRFFSRDPHVRGVVALLFVLWFATYGYMRPFIQSNPMLVDLAGEGFVISLTLLLVVCVSLLVARRRLGGAALTAYLNASAAILLVFPSVTLARHARLSGQAGRPPAVDTVALPPDAVRRDIYLIVLDKYTGSTSLDRNYGYDNKPFEQELRRRGFFVPQSARSNYVHTFLTLASMLNWTHVHHLDRDGDGGRGQHDVGYRMVEKNRTVQFLRERGYRFIFFPTAYRATARNDDADLQLPHPEQITSEFTRVWRLTTPLPHLRRVACRVMKCRRESMPYSPEPAALIDWKFRQLSELPDSAGPLFVLAHFTVPHEPYIYRSDCRHRDPYWPLSDDGEEEPRLKAAYIEQIRCVNRKVLEAVDSLLARSATPPIILLQSDHGHGRLGRLQPALELAPPDRVFERFDVFAAYHLPESGSRTLYDSITPVNVLPLTLNHYFGSRIPLQEDGTWWSEWMIPYRFTRVE